VTHQFAVREEGVASWPTVSPEDGLIELFGSLMGEDSPFGSVSVLRI
jgi:hypothetical protein